jgi:hypothetical protein
MSLPIMLPPSRGRFLGGDPEAIKKAVVAPPAPRLLKDLVVYLWSFKSRGAAQAPKIIVAKIIGAKLTKLHVQVSSTLLSAYLKYFPRPVKEKFFLQPGERLPGEVVLRRGRNPASLETWMHALPKGTVVKQSFWC